MRHQAESCETRPRWRAIFLKKFARFLCAELQKRPPVTTTGTTGSYGGEKTRGESVQNGAARLHTAARAALVQFPVESSSGGIIPHDPRQPMSLTPGTRLGPYEIVCALGAGGMGEVYRAKDTKLGRAVAVKVLPEALAADPDRIARFEREAKALAALNHPHIAQIYGLEHVPNTNPESRIPNHLLVMEQQFRRRGLMMNLSTMSLLLLQSLMAVFTSLTGAVT